MRRRSSTRPSAQTSVSPGSTRLDALEDRFGAGRELDLQQFVARGGTQRPRHHAGLQQRLRLGGEGEAGGGLGDVERLDAERVACQRHRAGGAVVDRDAIHAAQMPREAGALALPEMERRLVVAVGGEAHAGQIAAKFPVVVDFAVAHEGRRTSVQRLIAAGQVDDGESGVDQGDAADHGMAGAVRAAMGERAGQGLQHAGPGRRRRRARPGCRRCRTSGRGLGGEADHRGREIPPAGGDVLRVLPNVPNSVG